MAENPSLPPQIDRESLSKLEQEFYQQYGHALANWARLEQTFSELFCEVCRFHAGELGPALFFSGKSFNTRSALLSAAVRASDLEEPVREVVRALLKKARQFETARNKITHGYPAHAVYDGVEWQGWRIKEGDEAYAPGGVGLQELQNAAECFSRLEFWVERTKSLISNWRVKARMPVEEFLRPIRELPNDALLPLADPTIEGSGSPDQ